MSEGQRGGEVEAQKGHTLLPRGFDPPLLFAAMKCPPHSHYELCVDTCSLTCSALSDTPPCRDRCAEGCQCDAGFLSDGETCVPIEKCGCYYHGIYYEPAQTVLIDNCQQQCLCYPGKGLVCQNHSCEPEEECQSSAGILSCTKGDMPGEGWPGRVRAQL